MELNTIYTAQSYIDELIVAEKRENKDYEISVAYIDDDGEKVAMLVDGNHSFVAAMRDGATPKIKVVDSDYKTLEDYVVAMNDLSNPVNVITGRDLW